MYIRINIHTHTHTHTYIYMYICRVSPHLWRLPSSCRAPLTECYSRISLQKQKNTALTLAHAQTIHYT